MFYIFNEKLLYNTLFVLRYLSNFDGSLIKEIYFSSPLIQTRDFLKWLTSISEIDSWENLHNLLLIFAIL
jgi:hypothetical protein